jgi:hypothetical protein
LSVFENQMAHGRVGRGHMVEAVADFRGRALHLAVDDVGHGAAGDQPHHEFDAFAARFAHVVDVRRGGAAHRVGNHLVEPGVVPLAVDQAGARALELVAHATGAPDVHVEVVVIALHRLADGLPEHEAAPAGRHRVLHHIDRERNHRAGPGVLLRVQLAAHQRQRHGEAVVHVHLVDDGEVEVLLDDRLGDVRGQVRMADDGGHRARAPALVGRLKLRRGADGKGGNHLQAEGGGVVVVDQEHDVGLVVLHPLLGEFVALEDRLPVGFLGLAQVQGRADGGHVRGVDGCGDAGHGQAPFFWPAAPCGWCWGWASPSSPR